MRESSAKNIDVLVVGAGYAGLAAAALFAKIGIPAEVFESLPVAGGRARSVERDGFVMDYGFHDFRCGNDGVAAKLLREIGEIIDWVPAHGKPLINSGGEQFRLPSGIPEALRLHFLDTSDRLRLLLLLGKIKFFPAGWYTNVSFADFNGKKWSKRPKLRALIKTLSFVSMAPDIDTACAADVVDLVQRGLAAERTVGTPIGGQRQVINKMVKNIREPVRLNLGQGITKIHISGRKVEVVETIQGAWKPKVVLFTMPVQRLFRFMDPEHFRPGFVKYASSLAPTAGISVDLALARPVTDMAHSMIDIDRQYMGKYPSVGDPSLVPPGRQLSTWLCLVDPAKLRDRKYIRGVREKMREEIDRLVPGTMAAAMWERWIYFSILDGVLPCLGQGWQQRHPLRSQDVDNLFFAGDTARAPGISGEIAFESAMRVVPEIRKYLNR